jgi:tRNA acetyltransferase TAN1
VFKAVGPKRENLPFNLLITHLPGFGMRREALSELYNYIDDLKLVFYEKNKLYIKVRDPKEVVKKLCRDLPSKTVILRAIPVDDVVSPNIDEVINSVRRLINNKEGKIAVRIDGHLISENGRFLHRQEAASLIGDSVDRDVNLSNPDVLIYVKVTRFKRRYVAAVFVDNPRYIFSSVKRVCP